MSERYRPSPEEMGIKAPEKKEKESGPERQPGESQAAFLERAGKDLIATAKAEGGPLFDAYRVKEEQLSESVRDQIASAMASAREESASETPSDSSAAILEIGQSIGTHAIPTESAPTDQASFEKTQRGRKLFEVQPGKGAAKRETYWNTLVFPFNTESTRAFAKELLKDKTIVLLGGGRSRLKEEMEQNGISPKDVVNVDPFVSDPEPGSDRVVPMSASDARMVETLRTEGIEKADEIWAEYSVPAYLENPEDIRQLLKNIDEMLADGGTARIWPAEVKHSEDTAEVAARKSALIDALKDLAATGNYEIVARKAAGRPGFTLRKLPSAG